MTIKKRVEAATIATYEMARQVATERKPWGELTTMGKVGYIEQMTAGLIAGGFIPAPKVKGKRKAGGKL